MMGYKSTERKLFYMFNLDERVPQDHILRQINEVVDFSFIYDLVRPYYSHTGAPSIDPVVVFKMALLGYLYGITSERKLAEECRLNLAFMWFLGYDIDEISPNHSILSKARKRFGRATYEQFFKEIVKLCEEAGLIEGNKVFLDATLLKANASFDSLEERKEACELKYSPEEYLDRVWAENQEEQEEDKQHSQNEADEGHSNSDSTGFQGTAVEPNKKTDKESKGKKVKTNERLVSRTDPDAALITHNNSKGVLLAHKVHVAVDGGPARSRCAVEVTPGSFAEAHVAPTLIGKHTWNTGCLPEEAVADKGYGRKHFYSFLKQAGILPSIPYPKPWRKKRKEKFDADFVYDEKEDAYICPRGKKMYRMETYENGSVLYRVHRSACKGCPYKGVL